MTRGRPGLALARRQRARGERRVVRREGEPADADPAALRARQLRPGGEIVDGWETRRRREPGHDWALIRLGARSHHRDRRRHQLLHRQLSDACRIEACGVEGYPSVDALQAASWDTVVDWTDLRGDSHNVLPVSSTSRYTHIRLVIATDGGVARLRVNGDPCPDPLEVDGLTVDLAGRFYGGEVESSSDNFYSTATVLNHPHLAQNMGEGWETARRRGPGHDWAVIRLAAPGRIDMVEVDTCYYKCNASKFFALYSVDGEKAPAADSDEWQELIPRTPLQPDTRQRFRLPASAHTTTYVRLDVFPDGGVSRLRLLGRVHEDARAELGRRWFNALPADHAQKVLVDRCGLTIKAAAELVGSRPLTDEDLQNAGDSLRKLVLGEDRR